MEVDVDAGDILARDETSSSSVREDKGNLSGSQESDSLDNEELNQDPTRVGVSNGGGRGGGTRPPFGQLGLTVHLDLGLEAQNSLVDSEERVNVLGLERGMFSDAMCDGSSGGVDNLK